jgi:hypothetical protein
VSTGGYGLPSEALFDPDYIAAVLSSRLLSWVLARRSRSWRGGWHAARKGNLVRLPIRDPGPQARGAIIELYDACVAATRSHAAAASDRERDLRRRVLQGCLRDFDQEVEDVYQVVDKERKLFVTA